MPNQRAIERQTKAKAEGLEAFRNGIPFESNPYRRPAPFEEHHEGPLRGAWEAGWYEGKLLAEAGGRSV